MTDYEKTAEEQRDGEINNLPPGWVWTTLKEIADLVGGGTPSRTVPEYFTGDIAWFTPTEIPKHTVSVVTNSRERITEEALRKSSARLVPAGSVLMTSRASIGYVAIAGTEVTTNQGFATFIPAEGVFNYYLAYWLWANADYFEGIATGTTFKEISKTMLREQVIPLAPLNEQRRIVEAIEAQFTRLDAGVEALKRLRANLKRYKAAILKAACEGKLVEQDPNDEPASELLARILEERRAKWEADQRAKGKDPRKLKYEEPAAPDTEGLPELPEGWMWATTEQLSATGKYAMAIGPFGSNLMVKDYRPEGIPLIFVKEIRTGIFDRPGLPRISPEKAEELQPHHVHPGDLVITKMGEPPGDVAIFPDHIPLAVATSDCIKWTLSSQLHSRRYFMYAISFPVAKKQILKITRGVVNKR